jgi:hypothetical protein
MPALDWPPSSSMPRRLAFALVVVLALVAALVSASPATATQRGPCSAEIAGTDAAPLFTGARDDAIEVDRNSLVPVRMSATEPIERYKVELEFAGIRFTVHERETSGRSWASEVPVDDYGLYGMGLWKIVATSEGADFECEAAGLIDVEDDHALDPLSTIAGLSGLALALAGALGILAVAARIGKARSAPISGLVFGLLLGAGITVLLQQFSVLYPTVGVTVGLLAIGAAVGLAFSLFGLPLKQSDARNAVR